MPSYKINHDQRNRLDKMILEALRPEMSLINDIVDRVKVSMVATREQWAITYARDATFTHQVSNALRRWRKKRHVERGANPRVAEWRRIQAPSSISTEEFDVALIALIEGTTPEMLVSVPGVYEALSEAWNNDIIEQAQEAREATE